MINKYQKLKDKYLAAIKTKNFRLCHHIVGGICAAAEKEKMPLNEFVSKYISKEISDEVFNLDNYIKRREWVFKFLNN